MFNHSVRLASTYRVFSYETVCHKQQANKTEMEIRMNFCHAFNDDATNFMLIFSENVRLNLPLNVGY